MALALTVLSAGTLRAQPVQVGQLEEDYLRVMQLVGVAIPGSFNVRPLIDPLLPTTGPWRGRLVRQAETSVSLIDPRLRLFGNSRFPSGANDGAVWQGKGWTAAIEAGGWARIGPVSITAYPTVIFAQNGSFELAPVLIAGQPSYAYPWRAIDMPQRFGPESYWAVDPGQSEIRVDLLGASLGVSTANLWWGPGIENAIVMSDNAGGVPHVFLGTDGTAETGIGGFEARWIWGRLGQSDWFDPATPNDDRFITGLVAAYSPDFLDGLSVGFTRLFYGYVPEGGLEFGDYLAVLQGFRKKALVTPQNPSGDDEHDQMISFFGRWRLQESAFEVYGEWARNDHSWELRDFLLEPEHSQAYTLGLHKVVTLSGDRLLGLRSELTKLERSTTLQVRLNPTYYAHNIVTQGYTHEGQVVGAGLGPGGNSQFLGADLYADWGRAQLFLQRQVHDNDAYYEWALANNQAYCCHDVSFHAGGRAVLFLSTLDLGAGSTITREYNRYFFGNDLWNLNLSLTARWRMQ